MIDKQDLKTVDAFPFQKRGRPSTGKALTPAQRKARQRAKDWITIANSVNRSDLKNMTTTGLLEQLSSAVSTKNYDLTKMITSEILIRAK